MPNLTRNFTAGKMNKVVDERLVPNGEYIDAMNVRMGSTEMSEIGVVENTKGNLPLTQLRYADGTLLSTDARCIGVLEDGSRETIYWFVHDSNFPVGATGKLDMIVSYNTETNTLIYHVISIDDGGGTNTTLNFNPAYLITGVDLVDNLLLFTDDYNPPRKININTGYQNPFANVDQFSAESILVIKKPPVEAPSVQEILTSGQENFMEDRFLCFAYRYRYEDNEYSATSQFSAPVFLPNPFDFDISSYLNDGMVNKANTAIITYNTGGPLVRGIDLLFKDSSSNSIKVIEKLDKAELGLVDNTNYTYTFSNSKIFTVLPESEILRLYDNVPRFAKAQTIMGNRLMYGNYVDGYNLIDKDNNPVKFEYRTELITEVIGNTNLTDTTSTGNYSINGPQTIPNSVLEVDLTGVSLDQGSAFNIEVRLSHASFSGSTPFPTQTSQNIDVVFSFSLATNYSSVYQMATSTEFLDVVGTVANIKPVYAVPPIETSCDGTTFTDQVNCALPNNLGTLQKFGSGIAGQGEPILVLSSPSSNIISFQFPAMRYVDNVTTPTFNVYEYYEIIFAQATFQEIENPRSLHSNRGYEIGIVYMDEFNRATTALVSPNNTEHVPCGFAENKNSIRVTIPTAQRAPEWATRYKFVIKADKENYETIYSNLYFADPDSNQYYFMLEGENSRKVEVGDRLIVKSDSDGPTQSCVYTTVLEKEAKPSGFITPLTGANVPSGVYMKLNPNNFTAVQDPDAIIAPGILRDGTLSPYTGPLVKYPMNQEDPANPGNYLDYDIPAGSRIKMYIKTERLGTGDGNNPCEKRIYTLDVTLVSSADYDNMYDWFIGDNVDLILDDGVSEVGGNACPVGTQFDPTLAPTDTSVGGTDFCFNYFRFYRNTTTQQLLFLCRATKGCSGIFAERKRRSNIEVSFEVFRAETTLIFETEPSDALPDVWYENNLSFEIDQSTGDHFGNVQNQDIALGIPAIIDTEFFNCFSFGNGAESYRIRDSIVGKTFNLGNRVTTTAAQDYKEADRFADMTYSGVYNDESNVNRLNEFNMGLFNFKPLEDSFGPIYRMDGRETDVLVLQEDKISYVLAGKNLLSDAAAGGAITSVPEVLGTQIARVEKYGISFHPESYVQWGYDRYFTDAKRGAVIQLKGNSYSNDQLVVVSEMGMRTWFRDDFILSLNKQKLGGYDPYMNEYVLSSNNINIPSPTECSPCGRSQTITIQPDQVYNYCVEVGNYIGDVTITYSPVGSAQFSVSATYNAVTVTSGTVTTAGTLTINKNLNNNTVIDMALYSLNGATLQVNVGCPAAIPLTVIEVCVTNDSEAGLFVHNEYRYTAGTFVSPLSSALVTFASGTANPLVSRYNTITGFPGIGSIPVPGAQMRLICNKFGFDTFDFNPATDKFRYLRTNTVYPNNPASIQSLIAASTIATPNQGSGNYHYADFIVPGSGSNLYLIWDYRDSVPVDLCYSGISGAAGLTDVCCDCGGCEGCVTYTVAVNRGTEAATVSYYDCFSEELVTVEVLSDTTIDVCTTGAPPHYVSGGIPFIEFLQCDCLG
jgi:hypothetical protein